MDKKKNIFARLGQSIKNLFVRLFGFGKSKEKLDVLQEEVLMSPGKMILRNFFKNKLAMIGIIVFVIMLFFTFGLSWIINPNATAADNSLKNTPPNISFMRVPNKLKKEGFKYNENGEILMCTGSSFSIAISKNNKIYSWGADVEHVLEDVENNWTEYTEYIVQLSASTNHAIALYEKDGKQGMLFAGYNSFLQASLPILSYSKDLKGEYLLDADGNKIFDDMTKSKYYDKQNKVTEWDNIVKYFENVDSIYQYDKLVSQPVIEKFEIVPDPENPCKVTVNFTLLDPSQFVQDIRVVYTTEHDTLTSVSVNKQPYYNAAINLENPLAEVNQETSMQGQITLEQNEVYSGSFTIDNLIANTDYQFIITYGQAVRPAYNPLDPVKNKPLAIRYNSSEGKTYRTDSIGRVDETSFKKWKGAINNEALIPMTINVDGIEKDPIVKIGTGLNVTSVLTKNGRLFTWGSTDNTHFNYTIRNDVPIIDFKYGSANIIALHNDNSVSVYGTSYISADFDNYEYYKLSYEDRLIEIEEDINKWQAEINDWNTLDGTQTKIEKAISELRTEIENASKYLSENEAEYTLEKERFEAIEAKYNEILTTEENTLNEKNLAVNDEAKKKTDLDTAITTFNKAEKDFNAQQKLKDDTLAAGKRWSEAKEATYQQYKTNYEKATENKKKAQEEYDVASLRLTNANTAYNATQTNEWITNKNTVTTEYNATYTEWMAIYTPYRTNQVIEKESSEELEEKLAIISNLESKIASANSQKFYVSDFDLVKENAILILSKETTPGNFEAEKMTIFGYQRGLALIDAPTDLNVKDIKDIQTGESHVVVLKTDGTVIAWGYNGNDQIEVPKNLSNVEYIHIDNFQNYAFTEDGKVKTWGLRGYLLGTDELGRSILARIIQGGKVSMTVGAIAVLISLIIGLIFGLISGFYGGWIDNLIMRFAEVVNAFPFLPLAITLSVLISKDIDTTKRMYFIMVILGVLSWPGLSRLIRGQILAEREKDFVTAARALGVKERHIISRHILPNVINVVIVSTTLSYAGSLLTEAGLSFLGFGVQEPQPSWGNMLTAAQNVTAIINYWWRWVIPSICIVITALSINLVGDGLREAMDPKANER